MNPDKLSPLRLALSDVNHFSDHLVRIPLLPYQRPIASAIAQTVLSPGGGIITCEMPRQSGKNQTAATCEAFLLLRHYAKGGNLVKTAPTYQPQLSISKNRLTSILDSCALTKGRWKTKDGNTITLGRARETFLSAQPGANVVGATADIALFVDEGQEIDTEKFERDFSPMRAWKDSTVVVFGVRWDGNSFLENLIEVNLEKEKSDGIKRHFRVEPDQVMECNPSYRNHFEREVARLGEDHILIKTQYLLQSVSALGDMFSPAQVASMHGDFERLDMPWEDSRYFVGIDIGGESMGSESHDETVMVVGSRWKDRSKEEIRIVNAYRWRGANWERLHREIMALLDLWTPDAVVVDGRGIGNASAMFIAEHYRRGKVEVYQATSSTVSEDGYRLMGVAGLHHLKIFNDGDKRIRDGLIPTKEIFHQIENARRELSQGGQMRFYIPEKYGHDDILKAIAYAVKASSGISSSFENVILEAVMDV